MNSHLNDTDDDVYQLSEPKEILRYLLKLKKKKNARYSLRALSKQLGYRNPSLLSNILKGRRRLSPPLLEKILSQTDLTSEEKEYLRLLVAFKNGRSDKEKELYGNLLKLARPQAYSVLDLDPFRLIADWYHLTLLEMIHLDDFQLNASWISKRLFGRVTPRQIAEAIRRLVRLGLLKPCSGNEGSTRKPRLKKTKPRLKVGNGVSSQALRSHHRQMIELALQALEGQEVSERHFHGTSFCFEQANYDKAIQLIQEFHQKMHTLMESTEHRAKHEVYRLNTQFYKLTSRENIDETSPQSP